MSRPSESPWNANFDVGFQAAAIGKSFVKRFAERFKCLVRLLQANIRAGDVVMNDEFFADEFTVAARVGEDALVVSGVRGVRRFLAIGDDGFR